jgi:hypothetical protein
MGVRRTGSTPPHRRPLCGATLLFVTVLPCLRPSLISLCDPSLRRGFPVDLSELQDGQLWPFADFAAAAVPRNIAGVCTIWEASTWCTSGSAGRRSVTSSQPMRQSHRSRSRGFAGSTVPSPVTSDSFTPGPLTKACSAGRLFTSHTWGCRWSALSIARYVTGSPQDPHRLRFVHHLPWRA